MMSEWRARPWPAVGVVIAWTAIAAAFVSSYILDERTIAAGRPDLANLSSTDLLFVLPILSAVIVGSALAIRRPHHPAGWLFLGVALLLVASGLFASYAIHGTVVRPGSLPIAGLFAVVIDKEFMLWLMVLTLILLYVPTGQLNGRAARLAATGAILGGLIGFGAGLVSPYEGELKAPVPISNPLALADYSEAFSIVRWAAILALHASLFAAAAMLLGRFRSARGSRRRQLRWMALASVTLPVLLVGAFLSAVLNQESLLALFAGGFMAVLPLAAALAIEQDHLFDIDRLISRGLTYSLLTAFLVLCYASIVVFVGESLSSIGGGSGVAIAIATLATASIAGPARRYLQAAIDKRFNRREFDALATIKRFIKQPPSTTSIEDALRQALDDPSLTLSYWIDDRGQWVTEDGQGSAAEPQGVIVERRGNTLARVFFDPSRVDRRLLDAVLVEAGAELENARLRAAITLQLREVKESRARILSAQLEERRRLERNLHDGAQQRLLAVAMQLRASELSEDSARQPAAIDAAVTQLRLAVKELRDLANGLHPAALSDGGLAGALEDLASQTPILTLTEVSKERFPPEVEEAAWFIACEAVANAVKHAAASNVSISALRKNGCLQVSIEDNGLGGADWRGRGLRGIADRAEAIGGTLTVSSPPGGGTIVRSELPCALQ